MAEQAGWGVAACVVQKNHHFHLATDKKVQRFKDAKAEYRAEQVSARGARGSARGFKKGKGKAAPRRSFDAATLNLIRSSHQWNASAGVGGPGPSGVPMKQCFHCGQMGHIRMHCPTKPATKS